MVGGQYVDVTAPGDLDPAGLRRLHELKTGRLIGASVVCVLLLSGMDGPATIAYRRFAAELGVLFQIVDDILDVTGDEEELGKPQGSDERHGKRTYVSVFGLEQRTGTGRGVASQGPRGTCGGGGPHRDSRAHHRLHPDPPLMSLLDQDRLADATSTSSTTTSSSRSPRRCAS